MRSTDHLEASVRGARRGTAEALALAVVLAVVGALASPPTWAGADVDDAGTCTASFSPDRVVGDELSLLELTWVGDDPVHVVVTDAAGRPVSDLGVTTFESLHGLSHSADAWQASYLAGRPGSYTWSFLGTTDPAAAPRCEASISVNVPVLPVFSTDPALPLGTVGFPYEIAILAHAADHPDARCRIEGLLPDGLTVVPSPEVMHGVVDCGTIAGVPTEAGRYTFTGTITPDAVAATSVADGAVSLDFTLVVISGASDLPAVEAAPEVVPSSPHYTG